MKFRHADGFTLIELLLAVTLLSLITASIMGGVHLGRRSWETSRVSESLDELETAVHAIRDLLGRSFIITPDQTTPGLKEKPLTFMGAPNGCRFVVLSEGGAQWGGLIITEVGVENGPDGAALLVWTKPYRPQSGLMIDRADMQKTILAEGLVSIRFDYFGAVEPVPGQERISQPVWIGNWRSVTSLPSLVSVTIVLRRLGRDVRANAVMALRQQ